MGTGSPWKEDKSGRNQMDLISSEDKNWLNWKIFNFLYPALPRATRNWICMPQKVVLGDWNDFKDRQKAWMNRCGSFPLLSTSHSLFSIWTDLKRSKKIPGAPSWKWGEWIWLTGPSGFHRNSLLGLNISSITVFGQIRDPEIPISFCPPPNYTLLC